MNKSLGRKEVAFCTFGCSFYRKGSESHFRQVYFCAFAISILSFISPSIENSHMSKQLWAPFCSLLSSYYSRYLTTAYQFFSRISSWILCCFLGHQKFFWFVWRFALLGSLPFWVWNGGVFFGRRLCHLEATV